MTRWGGGRWRGGGVHEVGEEEDDGVLGEHAGLWAAMSTAAVLGDVGLARWGEQGMAAAPGADEETKCLGRAKEEGNI